MSTDNPRARHDLEFIPFDHEGQPAILVRDRLEIVPWGTGIPPGVLPVLALLDGRHTLAEVAAAVTEAQGGRLVAAEDVAGLVAQLDTAGLMDSPGYRERKAAIAAEFAAAPRRDTVFAGQAYPDTPAALAGYLDELLAEAPAEATADAAPLAIIAPHIDPEAGRAGYAAAYAAIRGCAPSRVIVLGVGHQLMAGLYCLTDKPFATPLGEVAVDAAAVARLRQAGQGCVDPSELPHKAEHSIEFQAVFLHHTLKKTPFAMVPILCGSPAGLLTETSRRAFRDATGPFLDALAELVRQPGTLIVAGVDFCHIGGKFGHAEPAEALEEAALAHDRALLDALAAGDPDAFWAESARVDDAYNVCGLTALGTLAEVLPPAAMVLLGHDIMREAPTLSAVSFAAAAFTAR
ncbi:AmmeMemoRadiSam system protein B [Desulfovibrio sp. TomC]|uniref:AmmeMemoRadiSam system protein B n=1 Tax=Desulfovibrio sp. TomC TaxID=1562888 RepID=UPI0005BE6DF2|nr:AmmeMemoRadiSam system protein B [Desulfovibrio sp. TomC]